MALTLDQLQAERDKAVMAMASPENVAFNGRSVTNRSQRDLLATIYRLDAEIARLQPSQGGPFVIQSKRGIE